MVAALAIAAPAMACQHGCGGYGSQGSSGTTILVNNSNSASVTNEVDSSSNTGSNFTSGGSVKTGDAGSESDVLTGVNANYTSVSPCGCSGSSVKSITVNNGNTAHVTNSVDTSSNSGSNFTSGGSSHHHGDEGDKSGSSVKTGDASSWSNVATIGNVNITEIN